MSGPTLQSLRCKDFKSVGNYWTIPKSEEKFFLKGRCRVIGVQLPKMALECTTCDSRSQKIKRVHTPQSTALRAFRLFCRNPFWSLEVYFLAIQSWYVHRNSPKFSISLDWGWTACPRCHQQYDASWIIQTSAATKLRHTYSHVAQKVTGLW